MAKDKLTDYDATASNNTDVGGVSVAEGMLPSGVNNAIREQMSHLADFAAGTSGVDVLKLQDDTDTNSIKLQAPASVTTTTTFTMPDGDGSAGAVLQTDGSGQLGWSTAYRTSNLIINGAMTVAQRGTSETGVTISGYYTCDRWQLVLTTQGTHTITQETDAPDGFANSWKMECTTADASPAAGDVIILNTRLEGQDLQQLKKGTASALPVTLSFWVKSSKTGTHILELRDYDNSRHICSEYTITAAGTWEQISITFDGDTTGAFDNDNAVSLYCLWWLGAGSDYSSGTLSTSWASLVTANRAVGTPNYASAIGQYFQITGVQLEVGETATPFEHRSYGDELARCQRYYYQVNTVAGGNLAYYHSYNDATKMVSIYHPVTMRSTPTATVTGDVGTEYQSHAGHYQAFIAATSNVTKNLDTVFFDAEL